MYDCKSKSEEEAVLKIFNIRRNSELIYRFLLGVPFDTAVEERCPNNIPFESKYYSNYVDINTSNPDYSRKSSKSKLKDSTDHPKPSRSVIKVIRPKEIEKSPSLKPVPKLRKISVGSTSVRSSKQNIDYRAYRDRHDVDRSPFPSIRGDSRDQNRSEYQEVKNLCQKIQDKVKKSGQKKEQVAHDPKYRGQFREISNLNYLNYERESSKEYARKRDTQKFVAHRQDIAGRFERVLEDTRDKA